MSTALWDVSWASLSPAIVGCSVFLVYLGVASLFLPGPIKKGTKLKDGSQLFYKCNGLNILFMTTMSTFVCSTKLRIFSPTILADNFWEICICINCFAVSLTVYLYAKGIVNNAPRTSFIADFVYGLELNPRVLGLDMKFFALRPAMIGWQLINLSFLAKHVEINGDISLQMALYQLFSAGYIVDYYYHEEFMLSTWDIIAEHYGLMLTWGDYVFIPFTFSIQNWFLIDMEYAATSPLQLICAAILFVCGYTIFRVCNMQKHQFKRNPKAVVFGTDKPAKSIGGKLLVSGFWSYARHMNYLGDLMMAVSYSMPINIFRAPLGYFYPLYLTILLVHRERRDEHRCRKKYKKTWEQYCHEVPYRIIPYVY